MLMQDGEKGVTSWRKGFQRTAALLLVSATCVIPASVFAKDMPAGKADITSVSPMTVHTGAVLTIQGRDLDTSGNVQLGKDACAIVTWSATEIACRVPSTMATGSSRLSLTTDGGTYLEGPAVRVVAGRGTAGGARAPYISRVGSIGVQSIAADEDWAYPRKVELTGRGFGREAGSARILISGMEADIVAWSDRSIAFHAPASIPAGWHDVVLAIRGIRMDAGQFGIRPSVSAVELDERSDIRQLILRGAYFGDDVTPREVVFGDWSGVWYAGIVEWSPREIIVTVPPALPGGEHPLWVWLDGIPGNTTMVDVAPRIEGIRPEAAYPGEEITIHGANFSALDVENIRLDGRSVHLVRWSTNRIRLVVPEGASSGSRSLVLRADSASPLRTHLMVMQKTLEQTDPRWDQPVLDQSW